MNKEFEIFFYVWSVVRKRWREVSITFVVALVVGTLAIVFKPFDFRATSTVLILPDKQATLAGSLGIGPKKNTHLPNLLMTLGRSMSMYQTYRQIKGLKNGINPLDEASVYEKVSNYFQTIIFGSDYVNVYESDENVGLRVFQESLFLEADEDLEKIKISMPGATPELALENTKAVVESLLKLNKSVSNNHYQSVLKTLEGQMAQLEDRLSKTRAEVVEMRSDKTNPVIFRSEDLIEKYQDLLTKVAETNAKILETQSLTSINAQRVESLRGIANSWLDPEDQNRMPASEDPLNRSLYNSTVLFEEIRRLESEIRSSKSVVEGLSEQKRFYTAEIDKVERDLGTSADKELNFEWIRSRLASEMAYREQISGQLLTSLVSAKAAESQLLPLESPVLSETSSLAANRRLLAKIMVLFALLFSITLVFLKNFLQGRIFSSFQLKELQDQKYFGSLPFLKGTKSSRFIEVDKNQHVGRLAFRLKTRARGKPLTVMVTSSHAAVGKTKLNLALGLTLRKMGYKVALVDLDIKKGSDTLFDLCQEGPKEMRPKRTRATSQAVHHEFAVIKPILPEDGLNALRDYIHNRVKTDVQELQAHFDFIIIDCAPISVFDTIQVTEATKDIILCVEEGRVNLRHIKEIISEIQFDTGYSSNIFTVLTKCELAENLDVTSTSEYYYSGLSG